MRERIGDELRIYSLHDVRQFAQALPWVTGVIAVLICCIILWGSGWIFLGVPGCRKRMVLINILLILVLLSILPLLLNQFDLPASLMPQESILDVTHYIETIDRITTSMGAMGDLRVENWLSKAATACWIITGLSLAATGAIVTAEGILCYHHWKEELRKIED